MDGYLNLWEAAVLGDLASLLERLSESDTSVDMMDETGATALHSAVSSNQFNAAHCLIENGANCNLRDKVKADVTYIYLLFFRLFNVYN